MSNQEGRLTTAQFEIMNILWSSNDGMSVAEIWAEVCVDRKVSRTTVLNLVDRLEKRKWLSRQKENGVFRYCACIDKGTTESLIANEFVTDFFNGSPSSFVLSLLGSKRVSVSEIRRLRELLDDAPSTPDRRKKKGKQS